MEKTPHATIGAQLKKLRLEANLTQLDLSKLINTDTATISRIENGKYNFTVDVMCRYATAVNCEVKLSHL